MFPETISVKRKQDDSVGMGEYVFSVNQFNKQNKSSVNSESPFSLKRENALESTIWN